MSSNPGGPFRFKVGDRVTVTWPVTGQSEPGRVTSRTVEAALGKVYGVRSQRGRYLGHLPEAYLSAR